MSQSRFQSRLSQSGSSIDLGSDTSDIELVTPVRAASFTQGSPCVGCPPLVSADCKAQLKFSPYDGKQQIAKLCVSGEDPWAA